MRLFLTKKCVALFKITIENISWYYTYKQVQETHKLIYYLTPNKRKTKRTTIKQRHQQRCFFGHKIAVFLFCRRFQSIKF